MRVAVSLTALASLLILAGSTPAAEEEPKLTFMQDGNDLVVSTTLWVNGSSHVLWTSSVRLSKEVFLYYCVFQNRDRLVRSRKPIKVEWRLVGHKKGDEGYRVVGSTVLPSTAELKELVAQLKTLM